MIQSVGSFAFPVQQPGIDRAASPLTPRPEIGETKSPAGFGDMFTKLIGDVDATRQNAAAETQKVLLGESDQLHSAMVSLQESSVALSLMVEVRNKLVESYQELMRTPV